MTFGNVHPVRDKRVQGTFYRYKSQKMSEIYCELFRYSDSFCPILALEEFFILWERSL